VGTEAAGHSPVVDSPVVGSPVVGSADDPLPEALTLARGAAEAGLGLKLLGGLAVRVICPDFPPRLRAGQDMDFACTGKSRKDVAAYLERSGCQPDRRFNNLNGDRQMYFNAPSGRPIDVMVDRLVMCHTLDFRPSFGNLPFTVDAIDVLLSKLQIVELNEKDVWDTFQLLSGVPAAAPAAAPAGRAEPVSGGRHAAGRGAPSGAPSSTPPGAYLDTDRFAKLLGADWGWWRTVTGNLAKLPALAAEKAHLIPANAPYDPLAQGRHLQEVAESAPKGAKWKMRARMGDRVRWYELPEEVDH
jgi:hypothetical protein